MAKKKCCHKIEKKGRACKSCPILLQGAEEIKKAKKKAKKKDKKKKEKKSKKTAGKKKK